MSVTIEQVMAEALELPPVLRAFVAEKLIESLDLAEGLELSAQWKDEIRTRCAQIDQDSVELSEGTSVFTRAYAALS